MNSISTKVVRMRSNTITLFMWGYQSHYCVHVKYLMNDVLQELCAINVGGECLLVGARIPGASTSNEVCVEPEDGKWPLALFGGLLDAVEAEVKAHPLQNMYYGDEPSMRD